MQSPFSPTLNVIERSGIVWDGLISAVTEVAGVDGWSDSGTILLAIFVVDWGVAAVVIDADDVIDFADIVVVVDDVVFVAECDAAVELDGSAR